MFHRPVVVMLGPAANHFVTVSGAENFSWREGMFGEHLIPLIGDGLITTDWEYHDRARKIMMPAFHRARMDSAVAVMAEETEKALAEGNLDLAKESFDKASALAERVSDTELARRRAAGTAEPAPGRCGG